MQQRLTASLSATPDEKLYRALQTRKLAAIVATMPWRWCLVVCRYLDLANLVPNLPYATMVPVREVGVAVVSVTVERLCLVRREIGDPSIGVAAAVVPQGLSVEP